MDDTIEVLHKWIPTVKKQYHSIYTEFVRDEIHFTDSKGIAHWSEDRFSHIIELRESSLNFARNKWADYYLVILILVATKYSPSPFFYALIPH